MGGKLLDMFDTTGTLFPILIVSVETRGGGTDSTDFVLPTESRPNLVQVKSSDPASTIQNMAKLPLNYDHMIQQQNVQTNNGQMLLMPLLEL
jgi:hypothetical protein